jgi:UDP-N-acetylmuramoyl-tripeptide--D-alanyl-D-alanine ligase
MRTLFKHIVVYLLRIEARAVLRKYRPRIIAITGSVGKTSAKDAIYSVVKSGAHARKSEKSFNSEIGLPLTILGCPNGWSNPLRWLQNLFDGFVLIMFTSPYPEWLVLEVGADRPGDISSLSSWLEVDIAVITRLPEVPVHVEFFDSPEAVIQEKAALIDTIKPGGTLILFGDDERTKNLEKRLPAPDARIITFGFAEGNDVRAQHVSFMREEGEESWPVGIEGHISIEGTSVPLPITGSIGSHAFLPALAAAAVGYSLGKNLQEITEAMHSYEPPAGRMRLVRGIKNTLLIDDTYNASPAATVAALDALTLVAPKGRRIAVIGDMLELGRLSFEEHRKIGRHAAGVVDLLITVGFRARSIAEAALDSGLKDGQILQYEDSQKAGKELEELIKEGDCILLKGSQSTRMEKAVEELMAEPLRASELLVRQDAEWKRK